MLGRSVNDIGDKVVVRHEGQWAEICGDLSVEIKYLDIVLERACISILQLEQSMVSV